MNEFDRINALSELTRAEIDAAVSLGKEVKNAPVVISAYIPRTLQRDWGTETIIAEGPGYCGKILFYRQGHAGGLQAHRTRVESFHLVSGEALVDSDDGHGDLIRCPMVAGQTFHIPAGATHRFTAVTDCTVFEVSTSAAPDRQRLERQYGEPETGGLPTTEPQG